MGSYIEALVGPKESHTKPQQRPLYHRGHTVFTFPILSSLLRDLQDMSESNTSKGKTGRPRGRRAAPKVPCDDCIARASENNEGGGEIELCDKCTASLHRPRRKQPEQPNVKRIRRQSNAIIDTAL